MRDPLGGPLSGPAHPSGTRPLWRLSTKPTPITGTGSTVYTTSSAMSSPPHLSPRALTVTQTVHLASLHSRNPKELLFSQTRDSNHLANSGRCFSIWLFITCLRGSIKLMTNFVIWDGFMLDVVQDLWNFCNTFK